MPEDDNGSTEPTQTGLGQQPPAPSQSDSIVGVALPTSEFPIDPHGHQGVAEEEEED